MAAKPISTIVGAENLTEAAGRFWPLVNIRSEDDCWEWTGYRSATGYGRSTVVHGRRTVLAHRVALYLTTMEDCAEDQMVLHSCDNPPCCNPAHLRIGTHLENLADMRSRGRQVCGTRAGRPKLTDELVRQMRRDRSMGMMVKALAVKYGVSESNACEISRGNAWVHVK